MTNCRGLKRTAHGYYRINWLREGGKCELLYCPGVSNVRGTGGSSQRTRQSKCLLTWGWESLWLGRLWRDLSEPPTNPMHCKAQNLRSKT